jgi:hypothetical protein
VKTTHLDREPVLAGEGVHGLLLEALLALRESLVPVTRVSMISFVRRRRRDAHFPTAMFAGFSVNRWRRGCWLRIEWRGEIKSILVCTSLGLSEADKSAAQVFSGVSVRCG